MPTSSLLNLAALETEQSNQASQYIDRMDSLQIVQTINQEDAQIATRVQSALPEIADVVDKIVVGMKAGGRLIYLGAGTSGRLGILDASECPPTYNTDPSQVVGVMAGGEGAMFRSVEGAEDNEALGQEDISALGVGAHDVVVGIAASGRTPYVLGGLQAAKALGATTVALTCTQHNPMQALADKAITVVVGSEVVTGSTRMKAGTAQKMVLNMLSSATMIQLGKVYRNLMVDVRPSNAKLVQRQRNIICAALDCDDETAKALLEASGGDVKVAIVMKRLGCTLDEARTRLNIAENKLYKALGE
ncbi:MAG: N-acetylmuramic acid 6-phosphate etherase [Cardiobacteriaceae bacterium]|nr:N-acetylmuramic acid 6-phosphate etherase [Cardiobacteriaceae bacterium]